MERGSYHLEATHNLVAGKRVIPVHRSSMIDVCVRVMTAQREVLGSTLERRYYQS